MDEQSLIAGFPGAALTYDNATFFAGLARQQLVAPRCAACWRWHLPPQPVCPQCWSSDLVPTDVAGEGVIHMFTELAAVGGTRLLVTVQLDEQEDLRFSADLPDVTADLSLIGRRVQLAWTGSQPIFVLAAGGTP